jgi:hypothetical protein
VGSRAQPGLDHHRRRVHPYLTSARAGDQSPQPFRLPHSKIVVLWLRSRRRLGRLAQPFHQAHRVPPASRLTARTAVGCRPTGTSPMPRQPLSAPPPLGRTSARPAAVPTILDERLMRPAYLPRCDSNQPDRQVSRGTWSRRPGIAALNRFCCGQQLSWTPSPGKPRTHKRRAARNHSSPGGDVFRSPEAKSAD